MAAKKVLVVCKKCNKKLTDAGAYVVGTDYYHFDCLECASCFKKLEKEAYEVENKTKLVCKQCNVTKYLPKCDGKYLVIFWQL